MDREREVIADSVKSLLEIIPLISNIEREIKDRPTALGAAADAAHMVRKCSDVIKGVQRALNALEAIAAENICMALSMLGEKNISTPYATVTPNPSVYIKYPDNPGVEGYDAFVAQLPTSVMRPHYPSMTEHLNEVLSSGGQLPYGLKPEDIKGVLWKVRVLSKKEL